ncbi:HI1506-related protein [Vibrio furnissii]|uniref:HI1506-related protein n=1 Tax=Vibrio furnissii TaxID=29494 RepID=UPI001EECC3C1|nr:HI1506-related protein [Vibrio furnissii]MCG6213432.1 HI1506-related protein [Vibrio furnissii]MCG6233107.1 HI1506-related protein [Vibrio furnissii]MCG6258939.1 HI1506-related protein [Vibrio furnissii]WJG22150.1 HI1506-related protein [Vibrio furnissii]
MSETNPIIIVKNAAHTGYRRAGLALEQGENRFDKAKVTDAQLAQLKADPRLAITIETGETTPTGETSGALDGSNQPTSLVNVAMQPLVDAIKQLDPENEGHFTKAGKPELKPLSAILGREVKAAERDEVWNIIQATAESTDGE